MMAASQPTQQANGGAKKPWPDVGMQLPGDPPEFEIREVGK
jgi:hypothetical protein